MNRRLQFISGPPRGASTPGVVGMMDEMVHSSDRLEYLEKLRDSAAVD
jgi:hypothetical protein